MITVSQLTDFDPAGWQAAAEACRAQAKLTIEAQQELTAQADSITTSWADPTGWLAVAALRSLAASHGEMATSYDDGATVVEEAAGQTTDLRDQLKVQVQAVRGNPDLSGPDEQGFVETTLPMVFLPLDKLVDFLQARTLAKQLTIVIRDLLVQADGYDRSATIALMGLIGIQVPPSNDGPIDLTDDGIVLQADLNGQDSYGDCTTLATLISLAHSDPGFIREHMTWDPSTGTYQVTLYEDGKKVTVSVDPTTLPTEGSDQAATNKPSWLSIYEQAIEQQFGDVENGQWEDVPIERLTGNDVELGDPPSPDQIREGMAGDPPAVMTADTQNGEEQPDDVDPAKRVVHGHTYAVRGVDSDGNVILQNPWGPNGGFGADGTYYPGEVHLTPAEYERWFGNGAILEPPY